MDSLSSKIEAIIYYLAEPVSVEFLAKTLESSPDEIHEGIEVLKKNLENRGLRIVLHDNTVTLVSAPEVADVIEKIIKEERERELGRASIETLAIIAYKGPVTKKEIEYIRGVNSQFALRTLLLRGLIEKRSGEHNERMVMYSVTTDTLRHLGLGHISELPEYTTITEQLKETAKTEDIMEEENDGE